MSATVTATRPSAVLVNPLPVDPKNILPGDVVQLSKQPTTKGRNVSGRTWKARPQKRASALTKTKVNNQTRSWDERQAAKLARQEATTLQKELSEEKRQQCLEKRARREENEKRRAENELTSMQKSVQKLNTNKMGSTMKAMSKKQLRQIKKTRVNTKTGVVEYVSAYAKSQL